MRIAPDLDVDNAALASVCDRYGIAELKIFGSRARGTATPGSDIDVLYTLLPCASWAGRSSSSPTSWPASWAITSALSPCAPCTPGSGPPSSPRPGPCMQRDLLLLGEMIQAADRA
jgi:Nucleotidyltransferase domain